MNIARSFLQADCHDPANQARRCPAAPAGATGSAGFAADRLARLRQAVETAVAQEEIAGAVTLVARRGAIVALEAVGDADRERLRPMRTDTLFRIASMTKAVTSVAAMMLYEDGVLLLNDPVSRYIPSFSPAVEARLKPRTTATNFYGYQFRASG